MPVVVSGPDPALTLDLQAVIDISPADTCLVVESDGVRVFEHRSADPQVPASAQKLLTAGAVLRSIDGNERLRTELLTTAPVVDGIVQGDVVLVGGGDPVLVTSIYALARQLPTDQPRTLLDGMVDQLVDAGIREIRGQILADDRRYDGLRSVPSWPARHVSQQQSGPLGALVVDDGYLLDLSEGARLPRVRSNEPELAAARALQALLASRSIAVSGEPVGGAAPEGATVLASLDSPTVQELVDHVMLTSDNQVAELLMKELGARTGSGGTTAAGATAVAQWAVDLGAASPGSVVVDGSGLDVGNQTTCGDLVAVLADSEPTGALAQGLPVAGRSGTLAGRFNSTAANGRLRAKTGSLNAVTSLAGFVNLPDGGTATFAYIANGKAVTAEVKQAQDFLAEILATWEPPCNEDQSTDLLVPVGPALLASGGALGAHGAASLAGTALALKAIEDRPAPLLDRCSAAAGISVPMGLG